MQILGKFFMVLGIIFIAIGGIFFFAEKVPWAGKLPGDILIRRDNSTFYFPITTCILISVVASLIFHLFSKK